MGLPRMQQVGSPKGEHKEEPKEPFSPRMSRGRSYQSNLRSKKKTSRTPLRNEDEEDTLPGRPIIIPRTGLDTFWREEEHKEPNAGEE